MHYSLMFAVCGVVYLGMLSISYIGRNKVKNIQSTIFNLMTVSIFIYLIAQIISVTILYHYGNIPSVKIFWRICWGCCILWYALFYFYATASITKEKNNNFIKFCFSNKVNGIMFIIFSIALFTYLFILPFAGLDINNMTYLPGKTAYIVWAFCCFINLIVLYNLIKGRKNLSKREIFVISFSIIITVGLMGIQVAFNSISIIPLGLIVEMYFLFLIAENPDLILAEENKKAEMQIDNIDHEKKKILLNIMNSINSTCKNINNNLSNLKNETNSKKITKNLDEIYDYGNNFLEKSDALYNLYNIVNLELDECDYFVSELLNNIINVVQKKLIGKRVKFSINVDKNIPSVLHGDYNKIYQVLLNILVNATQYTRVGKIIVNVTGKGVSEGYELNFTVIDTGEGIKDNNRDILDVNIKNSDNYSGIGLLISKEYISFLNGKISYESSYKVGTTFHVKIIQKISDNHPIGEFKYNYSKNNIDSYTDYSGKNILIVDDNQTDIKILKRLVKNNNFIITESNSSDECINKIKMEEKFDMIFVDDIMPGLGGVETLKAIKTLSGENCPPVIVTTSNSYPGIEKYYKDIGFNEYLVKPYSNVELQKILSKYF